MAKAKIIKMPNGETIVYKRRKILNVTALHAGFFAGARYSMEIEGLSHFFEHMLFKGTEKRSEKDIIEDRSKITFLNAYTSPYYLMINFEESNKRIEKCFEYSSDVLLCSKFNEETIENEKKVILEERVRTLDNLAKNIGYHHDRFLDPNKVRSEEVLGDSESLSKINAQTLEDFRKKHFVPEKFIAYVVSSLPLRKIKKLFNKYYFSKLSSNENKAELLEYEHNKMAVKPDVNAVTNEDKGIKVLLSIKFEHADEINFRKDFNHSCILNRMHARENSFHHKSREEGLIYYSSVDLNFNCNYKTKSVDFSFTTSSLENVEKVFAHIGDAIQDMKKNNISQEEIDDYIDNVLINEDKKLPKKYSQSLSSIKYYYLIDKEIFYFSKKEKNKYLHNITQDQIKNIINLFFNRKNKIYITLLGNVKKEDTKPIKFYKDLILKK